MSETITKVSFSEIDLAFVKHYLRIEPEFTEDDQELLLLIEAARSFVIQNTQFNADELDENKAVNIIYLRLINDLYDKRSATSIGGNMEPIFKFMLQNLRKFSL